MNLELMDYRRKMRVTHRRAKLPSYQGNSSMRGDDLAEIARQVKTRDDFIYFLEALARDYKENGDKWENDRLDTFLSSLAAFADDIDGYCENTGLKADPEAVSWRMVAEMLLAATIYE